MKGICILFLFCFANTNATNWQSLGIPTDPNDLSSTFNATTVYDLNLRAGPGNSFAEIGIVPEGAIVPVLGWINDSESSIPTGFWIRTEYEGKRGWLCAFSEGERLLEKDKGSLFPITILKPNPRERRWNDLDVSPGEIVEFINLDDYWDYREHGSLVVRKGSETGAIYKHNYELAELENGKPIPGPQEDLLEYPPGFWELSFSKDFGTKPYSHISKDDEEIHYYSGPGFNYPEEDLILDGEVLFVDGKWALVTAFPGWGWLYIGDESDPRISISSVLSEQEPPKPRHALPEDEGGGPSQMVLKGKIWPNTTDLELVFSGMYHSPWMEILRVNSLQIYQPLIATNALPGIELQPRYNGSWHETIIVGYPISFGSYFHPDEPFRIKFNVDYGEYGSFPTEITVGE